MTRGLGNAAIIVGLVTMFAAYGQQIPAEYDQAMKTLGKQGDFKDNVLQINIPRNDRKVTIDGIATPTPFGFGGWLAWTQSAESEVRAVRAEPKPTQSEPAKREAGPGQEKQPKTELEAGYDGGFYITGATT